MRKLRKWERYVLFPKTKNKSLEGEISLNITQKEIKARKAWTKPVAFIRPLVGIFTSLLRTGGVTASGQSNPFFGIPSTALRVGFDSLPKNSRSVVEQQSKTTRTTLEEESKRSRRTLKQHPKECRTAVEQQLKPERTRFPVTSFVLSRDFVRLFVAVCLVFLCLLVGVSLLLLCLNPLGSVNNKRIFSKVVHSYPEQVLRTRQVCVKYALSNDIVLNEYSTKALISAVRWPYAMLILYKIAGIFKAIAYKNGTSTIQNLYYSNTTARLVVFLLFSGVDFVLFVNLLPFLFPLF